ncbi:MAG: hypothetical protein AB7K09_26140 [Planctomycetota bacterium]
MTDYAVTHVCGHPGTYDLRGPEDKREAEQAIIASLPCHACRRAAPMPAAEPIAGIPTQVQLADNIRNPMLAETWAELDKQIEQARVDSRAAQVARARHQTPNIRKTFVLLQSLGQITLAQWWVNNRRSNLQQLTRSAMKDGFLPEWFLDE